MRQEPYLRAAKRGVSFVCSEGLCALLRLQEKRARSPWHVEKVRLGRIVRPAAIMHYLATCLNPIVCLGSETTPPARRTNLCALCASVSWKSCSTE